MYFVYICIFLQRVVSETTGAMIRGCPLDATCNFSFFLEQIISISYCCVVLSSMYAMLRPLCYRYEYHLQHVMWLFPLTLCHRRCRCCALSRQACKKGRHATHRQSHGREYRDNLGGHGGKRDLRPRGARRGGRGERPRTGMPLLSTAKAQQQQPQKPQRRPQQH